jgi:hypothetical protein
MSDEPVLITLEDAAQQLGVSLKRVQQLCGDGELVAVPDNDGNRSVPVEFLALGTESTGTARPVAAAGLVVKALPAVIRLLRDVHYTDGEIVDWMFRPEESLPGTPIQALRENRGREVKRRAQVAGY